MGRIFRLGLGLLGLYGLYCLGFQDKSSIEEKAIGLMQQSVNRESIGSLIKDDIIITPHPTQYYDFYGLFSQLTDSDVPLEEKLRLIDSQLIVDAAIQIVGNNLDKLEQKNGIYEYNETFADSSRLCMSTNYITISNEVLREIEAKGLDFPQMPGFETSYINLRYFDKETTNLGPTVGQEMSIFIAFDFLAPNSLGSSLELQARCGNEQWNYFLYSGDESASAIIQNYLVDKSGCPKYDTCKESELKVQFDSSPVENLFEWLYPPE